MKRLILVIFVFFISISNCFAVTELKKTVCVSGCDYTSLQAALDANKQNLVTADKYFTVEISGEWTSADTTNATTTGFTTDATRYINIYTTGSARHGGTMPDGSANKGYWMKMSSGKAITLTVGYVTLNGIAIDSSTAGQAFTFTTYIPNLTFKNLLIKGKSGVHCMYWDAPRGTNYVYNNIIYNFSGSSGYTSLGFANAAFDSSTVVYVYGNTVYNGDRCFNTTTGGSGKVYFSNNIASSCGAADIYNAGSIYSGSNNICSGTACTTSPLANGTNSATSYSNYYVSTASENFHIKDTSSILYNAGADLGSSYNTDIDGDSRPQSTSWDIGADEYAASGGGESLPAQEVLVIP